MSYAVLRRNMKTAAQVRSILQLPSDDWSEVQVHFGTDEPASVTVVMLLRDDQLLELARLATGQIQFEVYDEEFTDGPAITFTVSHADQEIEP